MRALAEWGNRLAQVGETRHAEFVRGRYDAEQAVEFARHQLTFAVQEAEMMSARAGDVERVAAGVVRARELELQGEVQQLNERAHSWLRSERDEVAQLGRRAQEAREVARDETLRASELVRQACRERDEGRNDGALAKAELQGSRYELRVACEERARLKMEVRLSQRAEAQEVAASRGVAETAALSGRGDGRLENQLAEAQQEAVRAREEFDRVCSELRGQGERSRLDAGEEVRRLKERVELLTGECRQSDGGGEKLVGETAGLRRGAGVSPRTGGEAAKAPSGEGGWLPRDCFVCDRVVEKWAWGRAVECESGCGRWAHGTCVEATGCALCKICDPEVTGRGDPRGREGVALPTPLACGCRPRGGARGGPPGAGGVGPLRRRLPWSGGTI